MRSIFKSLRREKKERRVIKICQARACETKNASELAEHAKARLGLEFNETNDAGHVRLEPADCLGFCVCAPAIMIDKQIYGGVTTERFDGLIDTIKID